ncbi:MAG: ABC transporter ATP-binding protein [Fibrobacter sp.]|nr:ABC transporter ATP-binding protein [Fibrobacter sp.]
MNNRELLLETRDLWKIFNETGTTLEILRGVNFKLYAGETVAIMGASGAGKSTFLNLLGALDKPTKGEVLFKGQDIVKLGEKERDNYRSLHLGFIFQFHHLMPEFTAWENVMFPARIQGQSEKQSRESAAELLEIVGLSERLEHLPQELSGGERQRVAVARALMANPDIVLADEPSGNLDEENAEKLHTLFKNLNKQLGQTFLIVTHDKNLANLAHRQVHIKKGLILDSLS